MMGSLLLRGMLVGVLAGLIAFGFARVFGEPAVDAAIAVEAAAGDGHSHSHSHGTTTESTATAEPAAEEEELVSRETQAGWGLLTGTVVFGAAVGGIFALVFAFAYGRVGRLDARATSLLLALGAFVALAIVPQLKYPANPPAVGSGETIGERTQLFFAFLLISVIALTLAVMLARRLWARTGGWNAGILGGALYLVLIAIGAAVLPAGDPVPEGFPAQVLWNFRVATWGIQAILWAVIGLGFGLLAESRMAQRDAGRRLAYR